MRRFNYSVNLLNQYTSRNAALGTTRFVNVLGEATNAATVTVNNQATYRRGDFFRLELAVTNTSPVWLGVTNIAVLNQGTNVDLIATNLGNVFVPPTPEAFGYDADGNMTNDGRFALTWDAENRLVKVESLTSAPAGSKRKVEWTFDGLGRRIRQVESIWNLSTLSYQLSTDLKLVNDGWRCVAELSTSNSALRTYTWGLDLSSSLGGAGGVGGLLMLNSAANGTHFYAMDGNGNTAALVSAATGTASANYEYEPFGVTLRATGPMALENPFRFSTKRTSDATDWVLYERRPYSPTLGRWLSKDPIEEQGGINLYGFVNNWIGTFIDELGLKLFPCDFIGPVQPGDQKGLTKAQVKALRALLALEKQVGTLKAANTAKIGGGTGLIGPFNSSVVTDLEVNVGSITGAFDLDWFTELNAKVHGDAAPFIAPAMYTTGKTVWHIIQWFYDVDVGWPYQSEGERNAVEATVQGLKFSDIFNDEWLKIYECKECK